MQQRLLTAAILIPLVFLAILLAPFPLFLLLTDVVIGLALYEFRRLFQPSPGSLFFPTWPCALALPWVFAYGPGRFADVLLAAFLLLLFWSVLETRDMAAGFTGVAGNLLALVYVALPLSVLASYQRFSPLQRGAAQPAGEMFLILAIVWISDSAAYFVGRRFGKHKITPQISPNKSLEGFLAAVLVPGLLTPLLGGYLVPGKGWIFLSVAGVVIAAFGTLGDLFESMLKRGAGVKDTSNLLPGHGGILDRVDSLLFAFPAYYLLSLALARVGEL